MKKFIKWACNSNLGCFIFTVSVYATLFGLFKLVCYIFGLEQ